MDTLFNQQIIEYFNFYKLIYKSTNLQRSQCSSLVKKSEWYNHFCKTNSSKKIYLNYKKKEFFHHELFAAYSLYIFIFNSINIKLNSLLNMNKCRVYNNSNNFYKKLLYLTNLPNYETLKLNFNDKVFKIFYEFYIIIKNKNWFVSKNDFKKLNKFTISHIKIVPNDFLIIEKKHIKFLEDHIREICTILSIY